MIRQLLLCFWVIYIFTSCSSRYVAVVSPETKMEYVTVVTPDTKIEYMPMIITRSKGIFFVENKKVNDSSMEHNNIAYNIYCKYQPITDRLFVGRTNARQLKFMVEDKTYLIDITKFKKRTAMVIFDGKNKPIIEFDVKNYRSLAEKYFGKAEGNRL